MWKAKAKYPIVIIWFIALGKLLTALLWIPSILYALNQAKLLTRRNSLKVEYLPGSNGK